MVATRTRSIDTVTIVNYPDMNQAGHGHRIRAGEDAQEGFR
jgi:hypothetical protein